MTLLESLQAEIATAEADLAAKKTQLASLQTTAGDWLSKDIAEVKSFFHAIAAHIFPKSIVAAAAPVAAAPAATITPAA